MVEGTDVDVVVEKFERCAAASPEMAEDNAVRLEDLKTETILFSKRRKHKRCRREIRVGASHRVRFNSVAGHLAICVPQHRGELPMRDRQDPRGGGQATSHRQQVRGPPGGDTQPPVGDSQGNNVLNLGADLERKE